MLASQCACMRTVVRRLAACGSKPLLTPRPVGLMPNYTNNKTTARVVFCYLVEMGGIEPPSRTVSRTFTTRLVGVFRALRHSRRQDERTVSQTGLGDRALTNWITASHLGDAQDPDRRNESG